MAGTFSSVNTALTALRYQQVSLDVASTNVANVSTEGYVRRRVVGETLGADGQPALWSKSDSVGAGVRSTGVQRMTDALLDARQRREHAAQSYLDLTAEVLVRVESGLGEPGDNGVAAAINDFRSALHDLANNPGAEATRSQVLSAGKTVADALRLQAGNVDGEIRDQRVRLDVSVTEVNRLAADLAKTNQSIAAGKGTDTSTLQDTRDLLTLKLSELTGATATIQADGQATVELGGAVLVHGDNAGELSSAVGADGRLNFSITTDGTATALTTTPGGRVGATTDLIDKALPGYLDQLDQLAGAFATSMNAAHAAGYDAAGHRGEDLFAVSTAPGERASLSLRVLIDDPAKLAASSMGDDVTPTPNKDGGNATGLAKAIGIEDGYLRLVNSFGTQVASSKRLAANQSVLTAQVDGARDQQAGVSLDEETVNLVLAQRAYEAAARVMSTMDEMLDTLINRMAI